MSDSLPLEPAGDPKTITPIGSAADDRPPSYDPPPVTLVAVADVAFPLRNPESDLDDIYQHMLRFEKIAPPLTTYRAEKHHVVFHPPGTQVFREENKPLGIVSPFFKDIHDGLRDRRIEFELVQGLVRGGDALLFQDPCGNWLAVTRWVPLR